ncbi:MAG: restriction endonuclease subunit S [Prevotella intermedia]
MEVRIGDCIDCNPTVKLVKGEEYPLIDIDKIIIGRKLVTNKESIVYDKQSGCKFQNGDTLMARITPCLENGKIAMASIPDKGIGSTELFVFRGKKGVTNNDFVYYFLKQNYIRDLATNSMTGASGRQRADLKFIKKITFDLPSLPIQQKIASILSTYDTLIENNNRRIRLLEQMAENLYKEWFVRFRFPGHEKVEMENGLPKGWKRTKLIEECQTSSGGTPSRSKSEYYINGTIPWIKTGELQDNILINTEEYITEDAVKHSSAKIFPKGTLLMAMYGVNIGKLGISEIEATCNQACCVFTPKQIDYKYYLYHYFKSIREYLLSISFGAAQQNLSQELIKAIKVIFPNESINTNFVRKIEPLYKKISFLQKQNTLLTRQRDLLLPRLMSGKLEVKP